MDPPVRFMPGRRTGGLVIFVFPLVPGPLLPMTEKTELQQQAHGSGILCQSAQPQPAGASKRHLRSADPLSRFLLISLGKTHLLPHWHWHYY